MNRIFLLMVYASVLLAGCVSQTPHDVAGKYIHPGEATAAKRYDLEQLAPYVDLVPLEKDIDGLKRQVRTLNAAFSQASDDLKRKEQYAEEVTFYGSIVAAAAAIRSKLGWVKAGTAIAGGGALFNAHYSIEVQAANYRTAADALNCIDKAIAALPDQFWSATYTADGRMIPDRTEYSKDDAGNTDADTQASYDVLANIWTTTNQQIGAVVSQLRDKQSSLQLATPSSADIQKVISVSKQADANSSKTATNLKSNASFVVEQLRSGQLTPLAIGIFDLAEATAKTTKFDELSIDTIKQALMLPSRIQECAVATGSK